jgi:hypothetical protein
MSNEAESIGLTVTPSLLTPIVQKVLEDEQAEIVDFSCQSIHGGLEVASCITRICGTASCGRKLVSWSVILKAVAPSPRNDDPQGVWYWKREALAYKGKFLHSLPRGLAAPRCYEIVKQPGGGVWLWLEDCGEELLTRWPLEYYRVVARRLGRFNGTYLAEQCLPLEPWMTQNWLHKYVDNAAPAIEFMRRSPDHPLVQRFYSGSALAQILIVWDERDRLLRLLDELPQTVCHQDAFRRNLFSQPERTVAIDWGYAGIAPIGAEAVPLVCGSIGFFEVPYHLAKRLDQVVFDGYVEGLRDAGWRGSRRDIRFSFVLTALLRYVIAGSIGEMFAQATAGEYSRLEAALDRSMDQVIEHSNDQIAYYQALAVEALRLLGVRRLAGIACRTLSKSLQRRRSNRRRHWVGDEPPSP